MKIILMTILALLMFGACSANVILSCNDGPEYARDVKIVGNKGGLIRAKTPEGRFIWCARPQGK